MTTSEIINRFHKNHPELVSAMKSTEHGYQGTEINPFHEEGSVWSHSMLVLQRAEKASKVMRIAALLHDVGKPFCAEDNDMNHRRSFKNHEGLGIFYAKGVLEESFPELNTLEKQRIMYIVANHGSFYHLFQDGRIPDSNFGKFVERYGYTGLKDLFEFYKYDHEGRFHADRSSTKELYRSMKEALRWARSEHISFKTQVIPNKTLTVLIGPPRSGKSTWVKNRDHKDEVIISRDDYVEVMGKGDTYSEKWVSLTDSQQKEIDIIIQKKYQMAVRDGRDIIIDMTNMSKKSRRKWIQAKGYFKKAKVFIESPDCLLSRNTPEKFIPKAVINNMLRRFVYPLDDEGFDHVEVM